MATRMLEQPGGGGGAAQLADLPLCQLTLHGGMVRYLGKMETTG